jgi:hypothetical protein
MSANTDLVRSSTNHINRAIFGSAAPAPSGAGTPLPLPSSASPYDQSNARAVQSIGQTTAIVIQDAGDMLRNVSTIETTAIGVATAGWVAAVAADNVPQATGYQAIVDHGVVIMQETAALYLTIGTNAAAVMALFKS